MITTPSTTSIVLYSTSLAIIILIAVVSVLLLTFLCLTSIHSPIPLLSPIKSLFLAFLLISMLSILFSFVELIAGVYRLVSGNEIPMVILEWCCRVHVAGYYGIGWVGWSSTLTFLFMQRYTLTPKFRIESKLRTYCTVFTRILFVVLVGLMLHCVIITVDLYVGKNPLEFLWKPSVRIKDRGEPDYDSLTCQVPPISLLLHFLYVVLFLFLYNITHVRSQKRLINLKMKRRILRLQTTVTLTTMITIVVHVLELVAHLFTWPWVQVGMRYLAILIDICFYLIVATGYIFIPVYDTMRLSNYKITVHRLKTRDTPLAATTTTQSVPDIQPLLHHELTRDDISSVVQRENSLHTLQLTQTASKATIGTLGTISASNNTQDDDDNVEDSESLMDGGSASGKMRALRMQNRLTLKDRLSTSSSDRISYALLAENTLTTNAITGDSLTPASPAIHGEKDRLLKSTRKETRRKGDTELDDIELKETSILVEDNVEEFEGNFSVADEVENHSARRLVLEAA